MLGLVWSPSLWGRGIFSSPDYGFAGPAAVQDHRASSALIATRASLHTRMTITAEVLATGSEPRAPSLLRPAALVKGDTVGIVAPSYSPREGWLTRGVKALERAGFNVVVDAELMTF